MRRPIRFPIIARGMRTPTTDMTTIRRRVRFRIFKMKELLYKTRDGAELSVLYYGAAEANRPLVIEIHGGGYCANHNIDDRALCEEMQTLTGMNIASVDYRLAPAYSFPVPIFDCYDLMMALLADRSLDFDRDCLFVWGHSAGGNAAMALAQLYDGFRAVVLDYPWLDATANRRPYVKGSFFNFYLNHMRNMYLPHSSDRSNPLASPVLAARRFPETLLISCGIDTIKTDSFRFEETLKNFGTVYRHVHYPNAEHGFIEFVSGGRNRRTLLRSKKRQTEQFECYQKAMQCISAFLCNTICEKTFDELNK